MINYIVSILISLGFWGKATQETEEKTEKSSWLRTFVYAVLTIIVCVLFYKTYQIQQSNWNVFVMQAKGAYNEKGESLDSIALLVRKFTSSHDSIWMKGRNEEIYLSGIDFKYVCSNDTNAIYKLNRNNEFFPISLLATCNDFKIPDNSIPGYRAIDKVRNNLRMPGPMHDMLYKYSEDLELKPWEKHALHRYEDSLYSDLGAAYKAFFLISKPESLLPFMIKSKEVKPHPFDYPAIESVKNIDSETLRKTRLKFFYLNGDNMSYDESLKFLEEMGMINGDMYEVTSFVPQKDINLLPKKSNLNFTSGYYAFSEDYSTSFFSAFDLSQSSQQIQVYSDVPVAMLQIRFDIPFELINCDPQPDFITAVNLGFKDPGKTKKIKDRGVFVHVKFPTMENKQLIRSLILTTILTALFSLFLSNLYHCLRKYFLYIKKKKSIIIPKNFQYLINLLIVAFLGGLLYYSYLLVSNEKILINENEIWYYILGIFMSFVLLIVFLIFAYKKYK